MPTFSLRKPFAAMPFLETLDIVDFDVDGNDDIILGLRWIDGKVIWAKPGRARSFTQTELISTMQHMEDVVVSDFNNDGFTDFATGSLFNSTLELWLNDGTNGFSKNLVSLGINRLNRLAQGDIDGDGDMDLLTSGDESPLKLWLNDGQSSPSFSELPISQKRQSHAVKTVDLDGDGDLDIFYSPTSWGNLWLENDGTTSSFDFNELPITVFPNLSTEIIKLPSYFDKVTVLNSKGLIQAQFDNTRELSLSELPSGVYFLGLQNGERAVQYVKVVRQ